MIRGLGDVVMIVQNGREQTCTWGVQVCSIHLARNSGCEAWGRLPQACTDTRPIPWSRQIGPKITVHQRPSLARGHGAQQRQRHLVPCDLYSMDSRGCAAFAS